MSTTSQAREELIQGLRLGPGILEDFVTRVPAQELYRSRKEGLWSLYEHAEHLAATQVMLHRRLERFLSEERPEFVPYFPDEQEPKAEKANKPIAGILSIFARWRGRQVELIEGADEKIWQKKAVHPEYEQYGFEILVRHILLHDGFHLYRMEELWLARDEYLKPL
jgi:hypothetical protein